MLRERGQYYVASPSGEGLRARHAFRSKRSAATYARLRRPFSPKPWVVSKLH